MTDTRVIKRVISNCVICSDPTDNNRLVCGKFCKSLLGSARQAHSETCESCHERPKLDWTEFCSVDCMLRKAPPFKGKYGLTPDDDLIFHYDGKFMIGRITNSTEIGKCRFVAKAMQQSRDQDADHELTFWYDGKQFFTGAGKVVVPLMIAKPFICEANDGKAEAADKVGGKNDKVGDKDDNESKLTPSVNVYNVHNKFLYTGQLQAVGEGVCIVETNSHNSTYNYTYTDFDGCHYKYQDHKYRLVFNHTQSPSENIYKPKTGDSIEIIPHATELKPFIAQIMVVDSCKAAIVTVYDAKANMLYIRSNNYSLSGFENRCDINLLCGHNVLASFASKK